MRRTARTTKPAKNSTAINTGGGLVRGVTNWCATDTTAVLSKLATDMATDSTTKPMANCPNAPIHGRVFRNHRSKDKTHATAIYETRTNKKLSANAIAIIRPPS